jgi:hypothetical protein
MAEGRVVERRDVPEPVRGEPERKRNERVRQERDDAHARQYCGHSGREREDGERGRPLGERDVLQEVRPEKVVQREGRQRAHEDGDERERADGKGRQAESGRRMSPCRDRVRGRGGENHTELFPGSLPAPRSRRH